MKTNSKIYALLKLMIHKGGTMHPHRVYPEVHGANFNNSAAGAALVERAKTLGYIVSQGTTIKVTDEGQDAYFQATKTIPPVVNVNIYKAEGLYDGRDLSEPPARAEGMDAYFLPSLVNGAHVFADPARRIRSMGSMTEFKQ